MTDRELMQQALDALNSVWKMDRNFKHTQTIEALRARLSQCDRCGEVNPAEIHTCTPKQPEPVAWLFQNEETGLTECIDTQQVEWGFEKKNPRWQKIAPLYTAPPQREWQGLTDEEAAELAHAPIAEIEAKLKEKNSG